MTNNRIFHTRMVGILLLAASITLSACQTTGERKSNQKPVIVNGKVVAYTSKPEESAQPIQFSPPGMDGVERKFEELDFAQVGLKTIEADYGTQEDGKVFAEIDLNFCKFCKKTQTRHLPSVIAMMLDVFLSDLNIRVEKETRNTQAKIRLMLFTIKDRNCVGFRQYISDGTNDSKGRVEVFGYYCVPVGEELELEQAQIVLNSLRIDT